MADKSKDTGTGGINIDGATYTADVVVPNSPEDAAGGSQGTYSSGDIAVDKTVKDISKPTRTTFAKYLSKTTLGEAGSSTHPNAYPVGNADATVLQETSLNDPAGNPTQPGPQNNESKFAAGFNQSISSNNPAGIKKGAAPGSGPDGNDLLLNAVVPPAPAGGPHVKFVTNYLDEQTLEVQGLQNPIKKYTDTVLSDNLYNPEYSEDNSDVAPGDFFGPKNLHRPEPGEIDSGTFDNIQSDPSKRAVTKEVLFKKYVDEVSGKSSPGGIPNVYAPSSTQKIFSSTDEKGFPASPTQDQSSRDPADRIHAPNLQSSYSDDASALLIKRGKKEGTFADGNRLLNSKNDPKNLPAPAASSSGPYVSAVLKKNRFTSDRRFAGDGYLASPATAARSEEFEANSSLSAEHRFGESDGNDEKTSRPYSHRRLAHIGTILQLKAAYEHGSDEPGYDPNSLNNQAKMLLPGWGQLGVGGVDGKSPTALLDVENIIQNLTTDPIKDVQLVDFGTKFEGTINSVYEKFSGFSSLGMIALATALTVAIFAAVEVVSVVFNLSPSIPNHIGLQYGSTGRPGVGTYYGGPTGSSSGNIFADTISLVSALATPAIGPGRSGRALNLFNIAPTRRSFTKAVSDGIVSFFGLPGSGGGTGDSGGSFGGALTSPGHTVVIGRSVVRSVTTIIAAFKDLVEQFSSGFGLSGAQQLVETIYAIRNSRFIAVMNIFAQLGDNQGIIYDPDNDASNGEVANNVTIAGLDAGRKISTIDTAPDLTEAGTALESRHGKSRLNEGQSTRLAWGADQAPSLHLIPGDNAKLGVLGPYLGYPFDGAPGGIDFPVASRSRMERREAPKSVGIRVDRGEVAKIEGILDAEYVPFYFHDLRTNEVIGFHAFLSSLSDDYTASYETTEAFGRVEPVRVYKGTQRKIGLSFTIAALDVSDFDAMWFKINQLLMMVYPQYTEGKYMSSGKDNIFVKPFTQLIGASPMIRLRVGNLFTTNYSRFNLAGVFGLYNGPAALKGKNASGSGPALNEAADKFSNLRKEIDASEKISQAAAEEEKAYEGENNFKRALKPGYSWKIDKPLQLAAIRPKLQAATVTNPYAELGIIAEIIGDSTTTAELGSLPTDKGAAAAAAAAKKGATSEVAAAAKENAIVYRVKLKYVPPPPGEKKGNVTVPNPTSSRWIQARAVKNGYALDGAETLLTEDYFKTLTDESVKKFAAEKAAAAASAKTAADRAADIKKANSAAVDQVKLPPNESKDPRSAYANEIKDFMDPEKNPMVKSFESVGGKGLAGFVESMSFDWFNGNTWDTTPDRKAPKMCKVTISFAPVHDISPGLSSSGRNRAPVYRLGVNKF